MVTATANPADAIGDKRSFGCLPSVVSRHAVAPPSGVGTSQATHALVATSVAFCWDHQHLGMLDASTIQQVYRDPDVILARLEPHRVPNDRIFRVRRLESGARYRLALLEIVDVHLGDTRIQREGDLHTPRPHPRQETTHEEHSDQGDHGRDSAPG